MMKILIALRQGHLSESMTEHVCKSKVRPYIHLSKEDLQNLEQLKPLSFHPEETPIVTTQLITDQDMVQSCGVLLFNTDDNACQTSGLLSNQEAVIIQRLKSKNISFNNFTKT